MGENGEEEGLTVQVSNKLLRVSPGRCTLSLDLSGLQVSEGRKGREVEREGSKPVSYTHLTLPTN